MEFAEMRNVGNMSTLEEKVDMLIRYCIADSEAARLRCRVDLCHAATGGLQEREVSHLIEESLVELAVPAHLLGYGYLCTAIALAVQDPETVHYITGLLYPNVAKSHGATPQMVERAVRHAIQCGWDQCDHGVRQRYFGPAVKTNSTKPTNSQYIARLANRIRYQIAAEASVG